MNTFRCSIDLSSIISKRNEFNLHNDDENFSNRVKTKRRFSHSINLLLNHLTSSRVDDVGLQLWTGCFLLADFVIYSRNSFKDVVILELGTGVGFVAVVFKYIVSNHLGMVYTDYKDRIVNLAVENVERNSHLSLQSFLPLLESTTLHCPDTQSQPASTIVGRIFDWSSDFNPRSETPTTGSKIPESSWTMEDRHLLQNNRTVFLAADVLYDDALTVHFFKKIAEMMKQGDEYLVLTLEKRVNFSVHLLREVATCYDLFRFLIHHSSMAAVTTEEMVRIILCQQESPPLSNYPIDRMIEDIEFIRSRWLRGEQLPLDDIPQYVLSYERNKFMEIWKISSLNS